MTNLPISPERRKRIIEWGFAHPEATREQTAAVIAAERDAEQDLAYRTRNVNAMNTPPSFPVTGSAPGPTLEQMGIYPGSAFRATPEQEAAIEQQERERIERGLAELHDTLDAVTACHCCRAGNAYGAADGLCDSCRVVVARLRADRLAAEEVSGQTRRQLAAAYLRQTS